MLPPNKKNLPELIKDPISLIQDVRTLIGLHRLDNRELAITGRPVLVAFDDLDKRKIKPPLVNRNNINRPPKMMKSGKLGPVDKGGPRRRRTRSVTR